MPEFFPQSSVKMKVFAAHSCLILCDTVDCSLPCATVAPLSMEFSRHEDWRGLPFPSLVDLPDPGIEPSSPTLQADSFPSEPPGKPCETCIIIKHF